MIKGVKISFDVLAYQSLPFHWVEMSRQCDNWKYHQVVQQCYMGKFSIFSTANRNPNHQRILNDIPDIQRFSYLPVNYANCFRLPETIKKQI